MITIEMFLFDNQCFIQWFLILCIGSNLKEKRLEQFTSKIEQTFNLRLVKKKKIIISVTTLLTILQKKKDEIDFFIKKSFKSPDMRSNGHCFLQSYICTFS